MPPENTARKLEAGGAAPMIVLLLIACLGFVARLDPVILHPSVNWGDEIFQTTEQAHRLVYGYGLVPWEFKLGIRSWILPGLLAGIMQAVGFAAPGPRIYLPAIAMVLGVIATIPTFVAYFWCRRRLGPWLALLAALVAATAPELVYFGDRAAAEAVAAHVLVGGLYVLFSANENAIWRLAAGGGAIGLALMLRVQILPAVAVVFAVLAVKWLRERPRWQSAAAVIGGFAAVLAASGALDAATLGAPFASVTRYIFQNAVRGISSGFSTAPWTYYGDAEAALWGPALVLVAVLWVYGLSISTLPIACAAAIIAVHSAISHKEHRFIYPAIVLLMVQAGFGLAAAGAALVKRWPGRRRLHAIACGIAALVWCGVAASVWQGQAMQVLRGRVAGNIAAADFVAGMQGVCGIFLDGNGAMSWVAYGGYTHLHHRVPLYWPDTPSALTERAAGYNILLTEDGAAPQIYARMRCFGSVCVYQRPGPCAPLPPSPMPEPPASR